MIAISLILLSSGTAVSEQPDEYNNEYCRDPEEIARWQRILEDNRGNDNVQALHALWLGLCVKVEPRQLTVDRANEIFEKARTAVMETFPENDESAL